MVEPELIAGIKTAEDWAAMKRRLQSAGSPEAWQEAYVEFFQARLTSRYLEPLQCLRARGSKQGEGFSIVAIQCTLVEFLESTMQGTRYRFAASQDLGSFEYNSSSQVFTAFLTTRPPLSSHFDATSAKSFYTGVRCALLHEARTSKGWRIHAKHPEGKPVDTQKLIVYRDDLQDALLACINSYRNDLPASLDFQQAFIRKFDSLCMP